MKARRVVCWTRLLAGLVLAVAVVGGCGSPEKPEETAEVRIPVITQPVVVRDVDFTVTTLGTVQAWREVTVSARTNGQIVELNFEKGDQVHPKPNQNAGAAREPERPLAVLEQQEYKLRWLEAEAGLTEARKNFERSKKLFDEGSASESEFDTVKAQFEVAQARRDLAKKFYDDTVIYSPISGIVTARPVEVGETVAPGTPLATVADIRKVKIAASVSELDAPYIRVGETYPVRVDAFPKRAFDGKVIYKSIKADVQTRGFPVELAVDNADSALGIGMVARVTFTFRTTPDAITVPLDALVYWENKLGVYIIRKGRAVFRALELGERSGDDVIVADGLSAGDELVVLGQASLRPGSKVKRSEPEQAEAPDDESDDETEEPEIGP